jgi:hypothetical protein
MSIVLLMSDQIEQQQQAKHKYLHEMRLLFRFKKGNQAMHTFAIVFTGTSAYI